MFGLCICGYLGCVSVDIQVKLLWNQGFGTGAGRGRQCSRRSGWRWVISLWSGLQCQQSLTCYQSYLVDTVSYVGCCRLVSGFSTWSLVIPVVASEGLNQLCTSVLLCVTLPSFSGRFIRRVWDTYLTSISLDVELRSCWLGKRDFREDNSGWLMLLTDCL